MIVNFYTKTFIACFCVIFLLTFVPTGHQLRAQDIEMTEIRAAIKAGSSKELSKYFHSKIEISIDGNKNSYNKAQAEGLIKAFFNNNESVDFLYIHHGSSKDGLKYAIGKFISSSSSFRVYMLLKTHQSRFVISTLDFNSE